MLVAPGGPEEGFADDPGVAVVDQAHRGAECLLQRLDQGDLRKIHVGRVHDPASLEIHRTGCTDPDPADRSGIPAGEHVPDGPDEMVGDRPGVTLTPGCRNRDAADDLSRLPDEGDPGIRSPEIDRDNALHTGGHSRCTSPVEREPLFAGLPWTLPALQGGSLFTIIRYRG
jgi:hypothetical protein